MTMAKSRGFSEEFSSMYLILLGSVGNYTALDSREMLHTFQCVSSYCSQMCLDYMLKSCSLRKKGGLFSCSVKSLKY